MIIDGKALRAGRSVRLAALVADYNDGRRGWSAASAPVSGITPRFGSDVPLIFDEIDAYEWCPAPPTSGIGGYGYKPVIPRAPRLTTCSRDTDAGERFRELAARHERAHAEAREEVARRAIAAGLNPAEHRIVSQDVIEGGESYVRAWLEQIAQGETAAGD